MIISFDDSNSMFFHPIPKRTCPQASITSLCIAVEECDCGNGKCRLLPAEVCYISSRRHCETTFNLLFLYFNKCLYSNPIRNNAL